MAESWAFITAHNPMSEQYTNQQNIELNRQLKEDLSSYYCRMGVGKSRSGNWPGEDSFFIVAITLADAKRLMLKFRQKAIVFGLVDGLAELLINESEND